jgi:hypothetical protein
VSAGGKSPENSSQNSAQTPNFLGTPLQGPLVIYLLDRGSGTLDTFDLLRQAAFQSLATLGPNCRFQLIFWETDTLAVFPLEPQSATPKNIDALRPAVMDIYAAGQSRIAPALQKALAANPSQIVLATGKSGLDNDFVQTVLDLRKASPVPIHTFALGPSASPEALQTLAEKTTGTFNILSIQELRALVD